MAPARRRSVGMTGPLASGLRDPSAFGMWTHVLDWLMLQVNALTGNIPESACVYVVSGMRVSYIGTTSQVGRAHGRLTLGLPDMRLAQHFSAVARHDFRRSLHRVKLFSREVHGMLSCYVAALGTQSDMQGRQSLH